MFKNGFIEFPIVKREAARAAKNWARADELRDQLRDLGVGVQDRKS